MLVEWLCPIGISWTGGRRAAGQDSPATLLRCLLGLGAFIESVILPVQAVKREVPQAWGS